MQLLTSLATIIMARVIVSPVTFGIALSRDTAWNNGGHSVLIYQQYGPDLGSHAAAQTQNIIKCIYICSIYSRACARMYRFVYVRVVCMHRVLKVMSTLQDDVFMPAWRQHTVIHWTRYATCKCELYNRCEALTFIGKVIPECILL